MTASSIAFSSCKISVPEPGSKLDKTLTKTLYLFANSTARICITLAPCPESSNISSMLIESSFFALGTILGSVVYIPSTSVYISQRLDLIDAAIATAVVSLPPRPIVVVSPSLVIP